jgi:predicted CXXCH cytochrome family protein
LQPRAAHLGNRRFPLSKLVVHVRDDANAAPERRNPCARRARWFPALALAVTFAAPSARAEAPAKAPAPAAAATAPNPVNPLDPPPVLDDCASCHVALLDRKVVHAAMAKMTCGQCHRPTQRLGKCKSAAASAWALQKPQGELCGSCHAEKDLSSKFSVKHTFKGRCVECHDAHASDRPKLMRAEGKKLCLSCHDSRSGKRDVTLRIDLTKRVVHRALEKKDCQECHDAGHGGASPKLLKVAQPDLCYGCHDRKDQAKVVHTAVRQGECLECHEAHSSNLPALTKRPRDELCTQCHETEPLLSHRVKHAPVGEGRCLECHGPHNGERPNLVRATGKALCMKCHDAKAAKGKGTPTEAFRIDMERKVVHGALKDGDCTDCHETRHSTDQGHLLKKAPPELCYGCHKRKDGASYPHSAVRLGRCMGCHEPHTSDRARLLTKATTKEMCFNCHQDDVTGRAVVHKPVAEGKCDACHSPHGSASPFLMVNGPDKQTCYTCHRKMDAGKVKHAALERYGCTGCHDPHGTANRFLLTKSTNDLCIGCHAAQADGLHVTKIAGAKGHVLSGLRDPRRPDRQLSCASCHNPHGSDNPKLFYLGATPMEACDGCHGNKSGKNPGIASVIHRARATEPVGAGGGSGGPGSGSTLLPHLQNAAAPAPAAAPAASSKEKSR